MSDSDNIPFDPHKQHTVYIPPPEDDGFFAAIGKSKSSLAWLGGFIVFLFGVGVAFERKAPRTDLAKLEQRFTIEIKGLTKKISELEKKNAVLEERLRQRRRP